MTATATFHRLIALLAILTPPVFLHRSTEASAEASQATAHLSSAAETVFRHYV